MSEGTRPIRVLLVEDTFLTRLGTRTLLDTQPDIEVVGEAAEGSDAFALFRTLAPDVVVVDLRMPGLDGIDVIKVLVREHPTCRIVILSQYDAPEDVFRALRAGALGYVTKRTLGEELIEAVRAAADGKRYLPSAVAGRLADRVMQENLTSREERILRLMAQGLTNGEIAVSLSLADKTIAANVSAILRKLGARSRTEAVVTAISRGLLPPTT